jgi:hypothetical protein
MEQAEASKSADLIQHIEPEVAQHSTLEQSNNLGGADKNQAPPSDPALHNDPPDHQEKVSNELDHESVPFASSNDHSTPPNGKDHLIPSPVPVRQEIWSWKLEILCILIAIILLVTITVVFGAFNNRQQPDWRYNVNLNTFAAIFSTIFAILVGAVLDAGSLPFLFVMELHDIYLTTTFNIITLAQVVT